MYPHVSKLCPPSLTGLNNLDKTKVSITSLSDKSTLQNFSTIGISKPIILCPISVSAWDKSLQASDNLSGGNLNISFVSTSWATIHHSLDAYTSSVSTSNTNLIKISRLNYRYLRSLNYLLHLIVLFRHHK